MLRQPVTGLRYLALLVLCLSFVVINGDHAFAQTKDQIRRLEERDAVIAVHVNTRADDCGRSLVGIETENYDIWAGCMRGMLGKVPLPPKLKSTPLFRIRNLNSDLNLTIRNLHSRHAGVGRKRSNNGHDLWIFIPYIDPVHEALYSDENVLLEPDVKRPKYWSVVKKKPNLFYIINAKSGLALTSTGERNNGAKDVAHVTIKAPKVQNRQLWDIEGLVRTMFYDPDGVGVDPSTRTYIVNWHTRKAIAEIGTDRSYKTTRVSPGPPPEALGKGWTFAKTFAWQLDFVEEGELAQISLKSIKAIRTSTGQSEDTASLFEGIEFIVENGPSLVGTGGAGGIAAAVKAAMQKAAFAASKAASKALAKKAAKEAAKKLAERQAKATAKRTLGGLAKYEARLVAKKEAKAAAKLLAKRARALAIRRGGLKVLVKTRYGQIAKFVGLKGGTRVLTRRLTQEVGEASAKIAAKKVLSATIARAQAEAGVGDEEAFELDEATHLEIVQAEFDKMMASIENAPGRQADEGWLQSALSPLLDDTPDDLEIRLNGTSVWPQGGFHHQTVASKETHPVNVDLIFSRATGLKIQLIEYDSDSSDDDLGVLTIDTANLREFEAYEAAFIYNPGEGDLYEVTFDLKPLNAPSRTGLALWEKENDAVVSKHIATLAEIARVTAVEYQALVARQIVEAKRLEKIKRDGILAEAGPDGLIRYDKLVEWKKSFVAECNRQTQESSGWDFWNPPDYVVGTGYTRYQTKVSNELGTKTIPGDWMMSRVDAKGNWGPEIVEKWDIKFASSDFRSASGPVSGWLTGGVWTSSFDHDLGDLVISWYVDGQIKYKTFKTPRYCHGMFLKHDKPDLAPEVPLVEVFNEDTSEKMPTPQFYYVPLFTKNTEFPEAFVLNSDGEPVYWMKKIVKEQEIPHGLCFPKGTSKTWQEDSADLRQIGVGTWDIIATDCRGGSGSTPALDYANRKKEYSTTMQFTQDGLAVGIVGTGETADRVWRYWKDARNSKCEISYSSNKDDTSARLKLQLDLPRRGYAPKGIPGWSFLDKGVFGNRGFCTIIGRKRETATKYSDLSLGDRWQIDAQRGDRPPPTSEETQAQLRFSNEHQIYVTGLTHNQRNNGCKLLGKEITPEPSPFRKSKITIINDSLVPWEVYWITANGDVKTDFKTKKKLAPTAQIAAGQTTELQAGDKHLYAIFGSGAEYGASGCVGVLKAQFNASFRSNGNEAQRKLQEAKDKKAAELLAAEKARQAKALAKANEKKRQAAAVKTLADRKAALARKLVALQAKPGGAPKSAGCTGPNPGNLEQGDKRVVGKWSVEIYDTVPRFSSDAPATYETKKTKWEFTEYEWTSTSGIINWHRPHDGPQNGSWKPLWDYQNHYCEIDNVGTAAKFLFDKAGNGEFFALTSDRELLFWGVSERPTPVVAKPKPVPKPVPVAKPSPKPVPKPVPVVKPKPVPKPVAKPVVKVPEPKPQVFVSWYGNPKDPRGKNGSEAYIRVPDKDWAGCIAINEDKSSAFFNDEKAFYDCADRHLPVATVKPEPEPTAKPMPAPTPFVNWYENPQDPRGTGSKDYTTVTEADWNACFAINEDKNSANFNNETAFYDCIDRRIPVVDQLAISAGTVASCANAHEVWSSAPGGAGTVTVNNTGSTAFSVFKLAVTGSLADQTMQSPINTIEPSQSATFESFRGTGFVALRADQSCIGAFKLRESRVSVSYGDTAEPVQPTEGADRATVFYQPAYDYCAGEIGLDENGEEYGKCYFAYPDYTSVEGTQIDLNPGGAYSSLPQDVLETCQGDTECLDAGVSQANRANAQGIENRLEAEFSMLNDEDLARCDGNTWGSDDFFVCLDVLRNEKKALEAQEQENQAREEQPQTETQEPGQNRDEVFYQPAYDYCVNELGLNESSDEYGSCYFAYPNYEGAGNQNNSTDESFSEQSPSEGEGADRETVFYQPAWDFCVGEMGLEESSDEYGECYFAYPNYPNN